MARIAFLGRLRRTLFRVPPYISLALALLLTAFATLYTFQLRQNEAQQFFERCENRLMLLLQSRIQVYLSGLSSAHGLFAVHGVPTRKEFNHFVSGMSLTSRYPGVLGMGWIEWVDGRHLLSHLQRLKAEVPAYELWPRARAEIHAPIVYFYAEKSVDYRIMGFDMATERKRFNAMLTARDLGEAVASQPIHLAQGPGAPLEDTGVLIYIPVYKNGVVPETLEARRAELLGFIYVPLRTAVLFDDIKRELNEGADLISFEVTDASENGMESLLYGSPTRMDLDPGLLQSKLTLELAHRRWEVKVTAMPGLQRRQTARSPGAVLLFGLIASFLIYGLTRSLQRQSERIAASEAQLRIVTNSLPALVAYIDTDRCYRVVNRLHEDLLGRPLSEIMGRRVHEVLEADFVAELDPKLEKGFQGQTLVYETSVPFIQSGLHTLRINLIPDFGQDRRVRGVVMLGLDVTEIRQAEQQLRLNEADARQNAEQRAFMAEASQVLSSSLDYKTVVQSVTQLAVPRLADWCCIHLQSADKQIHLASLARSEFIRTMWNRERNECYPSHKIHHGSVEHVLQSGQPILIENVEYDSVPDIQLTSSQRKKLAAQGCASLICVPLWVRGETFGTLSLNSVEKGRYTLKDLELAEDLGRRVSVAIDNAQLYQDAQNVNRIKDEFLATLSHELRTPLNVIQGHAELLRSDTEIAPELRESAEAIYRNCQMQTQIINDLLDVSAIITGQISFQPSLLNVNSLLSTVVENLRFAAEKKGVTLELALPSESLRVSADPLRLQQIYWNLLSNAIKFTPKGGEVKVSLAAEGGDCVVRVVDTGLGIDPEFLPHVFERFRQEDSSMTRRFGGLGLGLAIVRHLIELHGGNVSVSSLGRNQGSEFIVSLPAVPAEKKAGLNLEPPAASV